MAPVQPYFRAALHPFVDTWSGGPGSSCTFIRCGLWVGLETETAADDAIGLTRSLQTALLTPEVPYSVLPFSLRDGTGIRCDLTVPALWQGQPVPRWRGVPCHIATVNLFLLNEPQAGEPTLFSLLVLLPERDPPGPRLDCMFLGEQFLKHYGLHLAVDYSSFQYVSDPSSGRRRLDSTVPCGRLEML